MHITRLAIVSVPVTDQQVATNFYTEMLGFTVVRDTVEGEQWWVEVGPSDTAPTVTLVTWFPQMPAGSLQGLELIRIPTYAARKRSHGWKQQRAQAKCRKAQ